MVKEKILKDYWICRTIMGTIVLEEELPNKTRIFLYQIVSPKKISEVFYALNKSMPMDFYDLEDFYKELNQCISQQWVEKVEEPQINDQDNDLNVEDLNMNDSWGILSMSKNLKDSSKNDSELIETMFDDFGNPKASGNDLKFWLDKESKEQKSENFDKVEFKKENNEFNFGLNNDSKISFENDDTVPELPEYNPFFRKEENVFKIKDEFEIPINEEGKKLLDFFNTKTIDDFKESAPDTKEKTDDSFFNVVHNEKVNNLPIEKKEKIINKNNNVNKKNSRKVIEKKKTFFEKIFSFFKK